MNHLMIDLETFGNTNNAVIVQLGACFFDIATGEIGEKFAMNIDAQSCIDIGMQMDASTVYWWLNQSGAAKGSLLLNRYNITTVLSEFFNFVKQEKNVKIWSHATFDFVILSNAFNRAGIKPPWQYWDARDIRTIVDLAGVDTRSRKREGVHHNALDDCIFQIELVSDCYKILRGQNQ